MKTAKFIKKVKLRSDAILCLLSEPLIHDEVFTHSYDEAITQSEYVIVSKAPQVMIDGVPLTDPETAIFSASSDGVVLSWTELPGTTRGVLDYSEALRNAGYELLDADIIDVYW
jgi:hypothetical protein